RDAGLERFEDVIVVKRLAVVGNRLAGLFLVLGLGLLRAHACPPKREARRWDAISAASLTAAIMLPGSATPLPAMSNAVPWSTEVRMIGSPIVTLTAVPNASSFTGIKPWS